MDIEFHYNINFLIALNAGFSFEESYKIAYSAQFVDDNTKAFKVYSKTGKMLYENEISQISSIFDIEKCKALLLIHFIPGDFKDMKLRKDGVYSKLIVTPNSKNSIKIIHTALKSENIFLIGIASHAYADTWAHQNFVGTYSKINQILPFFPIFNIGHAEFLDSPDKLNHVWIDNRLVYSKIDNNKRFLRAIFHLSKRYMKHLNNKNYSGLDSFMSNIKKVIYMSKNRDKFYNYISKSISGLSIPKYKKLQWQDASISRIFKDKYVVNNSKKHFLNSDWFLFQEALKAYYIMASNT